MLLLQVIFYTNSDDNRVLNKNLTQIATADVKITGSMSIMSPVLVLSYDASIANATYMYISDWGRYYRLTPAVVGEGGLMTVSGLVDPLYTWRQQVLQCPAHCVRSESIGPGMVQDDQMPIMQGPEYVQSIQFSSSDLDNTVAGNDYYYILTVK